MKSNQAGGMNVLLIPLIFAVLFFFSALGFGAWAYMERTDYKENVDQKVDTAVEVAVQKAQSEKDNEFIQREKEPYRDFQGPATLGSVKFKYPKTWSGHLKDSNTELTLLMHPQLVSGNDKSLYALRVEVVSTPYDKLVTSLDNNVKTGKVKASPFRLEKVSDIIGVRLDGEIDSGKNGSMIILPLRDKSLKISTDAQDYVADYNNIILKNFSFTP